MTSAGISAALYASLHSSDYIFLNLIRMGYLRVARFRPGPLVQARRVVSEGSRWSSDRLRSLLLTDTPSCDKRRQRFPVV
jgi:hypothetical protein